MRLLPFALLFWPLIEIAGFVAVGRAVGILATIALVLLSAVVGGFLLRTEGVRVLRQTLIALQSGQRPDRALAHAALTALGGVLLILPGFVSDIVGIALFLPPARAAVIAIFAWMLGPFVVVETRAPGRRAGVVDLDPDEWRGGDARPPVRPALEHEPGPDRGSDNGDDRGGSGAPRS